MDDFKIILYILAAVAYFLFMQWRKAFNSPNEQEEDIPKPRQRQEQPRQPARPATSFEDILRELQPKAEMARQEMETAKEKAKEYIPSEAKPEISAPKYRNYEQTVPKVLSWEKAAEAREALRRSQDMRQASFKAYDKDQQKDRSRYAKMLKNPATVRDAFVLSEIFNRKYN